MSSDHTSFLIDLLIIFFIIFINSLFVLSEIAILTSSKAKLHKMTAKGHRGAKQAMRIMQQPEVFLSTMQVGITLMGALLGLFGGTRVSEYLSIQIREIPGIAEQIADYSLVIASFISLSVITYITVLSEIFPKRLAMIQPEKIACVMSYGINLVIKLIYPLSFVLTISTQYLLNFFKIQDQSNNVSIDEIKFVLSQAASVGTLHKTQHDLMRRLMNLMSMQVRTIMTPRNKIISLDISDKEKNNLDKLKKNSYNFFPVINGDLNQIIGIVSIKALFIQERVDNAILYECAKSSNIVFVPEMAAITKLIDLFSTKQVKTALVVDEYGELLGLVTVEDILEEIVGEFSGQTPHHQDYFTPESEGVVLVEGVCPLRDLNRKLGTHFRLDGPRTLNGLILETFEDIPEPGMALKIDGYPVEIVQTQDRMVRVARVTLQPVLEQRAVDGGF